MGDRRTCPDPAELTQFPGEAQKGSVVVKFNPEGQVLMTLGKPGIRGNPPDALTEPTDVTTDPVNGDIYVAESLTRLRRQGRSARGSVATRMNMPSPSSGGGDTPSSS